MKFYSHVAITIPKWNLNLTEMNNCVFLLIFLTKNKVWLINLVVWTRLGKISQRIATYYPWFLIYILSHTHTLSLSFLVTPYTLYTQSLSDQTLFFLKYFIKEVYYYFKYFNENYSCMLKACSWIIIKKKKFQFNDNKVNITIECSTYSNYV